MSWRQPPFFRTPLPVRINCLYVDTTVTVRLPETAVRAWASSDQVSIEGELQHTNGDKLTILVEKDFACLAPREGEDESDMFPHPAAGTDEQSC